MKNSNTKYYFPAIIWAILIFIVSSIPDLSTPSLGFTYADKVAHWGEYLIFGFLMALAFWKTGRSRPYLLPLLICSAFGAFDELHQLFIPGRVADIFDWLADFAGTASGAAIYILIKYRSSGRPTRQTIVDKVK